MNDDNEKSFDLVFRQHQPRLLGYVRSKMQSLEEAEDLVQDVYLQAMSSLNVLDAVDNLAGWLFTAARNKVIDWYRRKKTPMLSFERDGETGDLRDLLEQADEAVFNEDTRQLVLEVMIDAIETLPEKQKFVFIENVVQGRTFRELAQESGESINTLLARKRYAVKFLRHRLKDMKSLLNETER